MTKFNEVEFKLFGLLHEKNGAVRADVFAKKLTQFINGLKAADKYLNGGRSLNYLITNLEYGSAVARITEEQLSTKLTPKNSSIGYYQDTLIDINDGKKIDSDIPKEILKTIASLGDGSSKSFSHGEIEFVGQKNNVIRIDNFFDRRADKVLEVISKPDNIVKAFSGMAFSEYAGTIKEVDLRGKIARAKLFLSAGGREIDCVCNSISVPNLRQALNSRVIVNAKAFYDGYKRLPERLDIQKIRILKKEPNLARWRGAFNFVPEVNESSW